MTCSEIGDEGAHTICFQAKLTCLPPNDAESMPMHIEKMAGMGGAAARLEGVHLEGVRPSLRYVALW